MKEESVALYYKEGSSDKVYNVWLKKTSTGGGWSVQFSYGRRGAALTGGNKVTGANYDSAKKIYDKLVSEKRSKGYQSTGSSGPVMASTTSGKDTGYRPQLLNEIEEAEVLGYIKNPEFCAQEKFDGRNRLLIRDRKFTGGSNRKGIAVELPDGVAKELIVLPEGTVIAGEAIDDYVMCFDLISEKGKPYKERLQILYNMLSNPAFKHLRKVESAWTEATKENLLTELRKGNAEGIVFKHKDAHYTPGRPASGGSQLKFKFTKTVSVIAGSVTKGKRSVEMWVLDGDLRVNVGSVTIYPNQDLPKKGDILEVKYLYAYKGGSLFQPVNLGVRDDLDEKDCTIEQLKYKKEEIVN